ncbi:hypothetical protein BH09PAT2_BH09PAT2_00850 [soil metagenome]
MITGDGLNTIFNFIVLPLTGLVGLLAIIYGSFLLMTSQGNSEQIQRGKNWVTRAIVGIIFNFTLLLLIRTIVQILGIPGFGP